jgi:hypothetical protein
MANSYRMNYGYYKLGNVCVSSTIALTTNEKFLSPDDPVYSRYCNYMYQYPGETYNMGVGDHELVGVTPQDTSPMTEYNTGPEFDKSGLDLTYPPRKPEPKSCSGCKMMR